MHRRIDQRYEKEDRDNGDLQQPERLAPGERFSRTSAGRGMRQQQGKRGESQRDDASDHKDPTDLDRRRIGTQQEDEGPARQHPSHGAAHANLPEIVHRITKIGESDGVGHRDRRHVEDAVDQVEGEECREVRREGNAEQAQAGKDVADAKETLCRKMPVRELVREEDCDQTGHTPARPHHCLLRSRKSQHRHVGEQLRRPCAPNRQLQNHHDKQANPHHTHLKSVSWRASKRAVAGGRSRSTLCTIG